MNQLDIYYRALIEYRKLTGANLECSAFLSAASEADRPTDRIVAVRNICTIDEDWVNEIEKGLDFIEKAIKEERQFILSQGEVVPIEKVKNFSKESVKHLAKHAELITREQKDDEIVPDHLYTVERLNDYKVYENRFLYMLLCYLRDFVLLRYNKILDLSNKYEGNLYINKEIVVGRRKLMLKIELNEERRDDQYLREHNEAKETIDRISLILKAILAFLATPLMEDAAKAPMLKPPITKTNVLKMDKNFKGAVALYDYIMAYTKVGYTVEEKREEISPFGRELSGDLAEACAMLSFITYSYGLNMRAELKRDYDREEETRRRELLRKKAEQIELLRRKLASSEVTIEEYTIELQNYIKSLEKENARIESLTSKLDAVTGERNTLTKKVEKLSGEVEALETQAKELISNHVAELEAKERECADRIYETVRAHEAEIKKITENHYSELRSMSDIINSEKENHRKKQNESAESLRASEAKYAELMNSFNALLEEKRLAESKLKAYRAANGLTDASESFTDKESFDELEREYEAFTKYYKKQWSTAKRAIRRDMLNLKALKAKDTENDDKK